MPFLTTCAVTTDFKTFKASNFKIVNQAYAFALAFAVRHLDAVDSTARRCVGFGVSVTQKRWSEVRVHEKENVFYF